MKPQYVIHSHTATEEFFKELKAALPSMAEVPHRVRSHKDLFQEDELFKKMMDKGPWSEFKHDVLLNETYWSVLLEEFEIKDHEVLVQPKNLPFNGEFSEPRGGIHEHKPDELFLYPRLDIGYAGVGYHKLPHIDFPQRIISCLWYFSEQDDFEGGEFEIWNGTDRITNKISIEENKSIFMLQNHEAYHGVSEIKKLKTDKPRIAAYIALSSSKPIWKLR